MGQPGIPITPIVPNTSKLAISAIGTTIAATLSPWWGFVASVGLPLSWPALS
jgi:hypothetical protein